MQELFLFVWFTVEDFVFVVGVLSLDFGRDRRTLVASMGTGNIGSQLTTGTDAHGETALRIAPNGFLESPRKDRVPSELKTQVIEIYSRTGNFTGACRTVGVDPRNMRLHIAADPVFKQAVDEAREGICDKAEGHIVEHMSRPNNVVDRLAWLRAWRPERWAPQQLGDASRSPVEITVNLSTKAIDYVRPINTTATATPTDATDATIAPLHSPDKNPNT